LCAARARAVPPVPVLRVVLRVVLLVVVLTPKGLEGSLELFRVGRGP